MRPGLAPSLNPRTSTKLRMPLASLSTTALSITRSAAPIGGFAFSRLVTLSKFRSHPLQNDQLFHSFKATQLSSMADKDATEAPPSKNPANLSTHVHKLHDVIGDNPTVGWEKCWEDGLTPWDLGRPTPIVEHLLRNDLLPKGRALVPGCGSVSAHLGVQYAAETSIIDQTLGFDAVAMACLERCVIGLDVSDVAIRKAKELSSSSPNAKYLSFIKEDFFNWHPTELFDLIFDYTFFCAIEPSMRPAWGRRMMELLKPDGELITLMFPIDDHIGGPPFSVSVADYMKVLSPLGFQAISITENELAIGPRKGREKLGRWKKTETRPSLL